MKLTTPQDIDLSDELAADAADCIESLQRQLASALPSGAPDPELGWDGTGQIFDPNCHCEKCALGRQQQRARRALKEQAS